MSKRTKTSPQSQSNSNGEGEFPSSERRDLNAFTALSSVAVAPPPRIQPHPSTRTSSTSPLALSATAITSNEAVDVDVNVVDDVDVEAKFRALDVTPSSAMDLDLNANVPDGEVQPPLDNNQDKQSAPPPLTSMASTASSLATAPASTTTTTTTTTIPTTTSGLLSTSTSLSVESTPTASPCSSRPSSRGATDPSSSAHSSPRARSTPRPPPRGSALTSSGAFVAKPSPSSVTLVLPPPPTTSTTTSSTTTPPPTTPSRIARTSTASASSTAQSQSQSQSQSTPTAKAPPTSSRRNRRAFELDEAALLFYSSTQEQEAEEIALARCFDSGVPRVRCLTFATLADSKGKPFTCFAIRVQTPTHAWTVWRRYTDFRTLLDELVNSNRAPIAALPPKTPFGGNFHPDFLEKRRNSLEAWMNRALEADPALATFHAVRAFLVDGANRPPSGWPTTHAVPAALDAIATPFGVGVPEFSTPLRLLAATAAGASTSSSASSSSSSFGSASNLVAAQVQTSSVSEVAVATTSEQLPGEEAGGDAKGQASTQGDDVERMDVVGGSTNDAAPHLHTPTNEEQTPPPPTTPPPPPPPPLPQTAQTAQPPHPLPNVAFITPPRLDRAPLFKDHGNTTTNDVVMQTPPQIRVASELDAFTTPLPQHRGSTHRAPSSPSPTPATSTTTSNNNNLNNLIPSRSSATSPTSPLSPMSPSTSKVSLSDFSNLKILGKGAFGEVKLCAKRSGEDVGHVYAMKTLSKQFVVEKKQVKHTLTERSVLERVKGHPFFAKLHYAFQSEDHLHMVMEFCAGGELFFHLGQMERFPEHLARFYAAEIALALQHLHDNGIAYRDLKPENVLLSASGHVKLVDFGLSKEGVEAVSEGSTSYCGTVEYLAPEIVDKRGHGTGVDWWGLGALLYEMVTGLPPWYSVDKTKMMASILAAPLEFPSFMSQAARSAVSEFMKRSPEQRLGAKGIDEVKEHIFFACLDFDALLALKVTPPLMPRLRGPDDTSYFETSFTSLPVDAAGVGKKASVVGRGGGGFGAFPSLVPPSAAQVGVLATTTTTTTSLPPALALEDVTSAAFAALIPLRSGSGSGGGGGGGSSTGPKEVSRLTLGQSQGQGQGQGVVHGKVPPMVIVQLTQFSGFTFQEAQGWAAAGEVDAVGGGAVAGDGESGNEVASALPTATAQSTLPLPSATGENQGRFGFVTPPVVLHPPQVHQEHGQQQQQQQQQRGDGLTWSPPPLPPHKRMSPTKPTALHAVYPRASRGASNGSGPSDSPQASPMKPQPLDSHASSSSSLSANPASAFARLAFGGIGAAVGLVTSHSQKTTVAPSPLSSPSGSPSSSPTHGGGASQPLFQISSGPVAVGGQVGQGSVVPGGGGGVGVGAAASPLSASSSSHAQTQSEAASALAATASGSGSGDVVMRDSGRSTPTEMQGAA